MKEQIHHVNEQVQSGLSYLAGGTAIAAGTWLEISNAAQAIALVIGCGVVFLRLIHDSVKLYRLLNEKNKS